jgi:hypothetical protein
MYKSCYCVLRHMDAQSATQKNGGEDPTAGSYGASSACIREHTSTLVGDITYFLLQNPVSLEAIELRRVVPSPFDCVAEPDLPPKMLRLLPPSFSLLSSGGKAGELPRDPLTAAELSVS